MDKFLKVVRILLEIGFTIILSLILINLNSEINDDDFYSYCSMLIMFIVLIAEWIRRYKENNETKMINKIAYISLIIFVFFTSIYIMKLSADYHKPEIKYSKF